MKVEVVKQRMPFGNRYYAIGESIDMPDSAARALLGVGLVKKISDSEPKTRRVYKRRGYKRRDMAPEPVVEPEIVEPEIVEPAVVEVEPEIVEPVITDETEE